MTTPKYTPGDEVLVKSWGINKYIVDDIPKGADDVYYLKSLDGEYSGFNFESDLLPYTSTNLLNILVEQAVEVVREYMKKYPLVKYKGEWRGSQEIEKELLTGDNLDYREICALSDYIKTLKTK